MNFLQQITGKPGGHDINRIQKFSPEQMKLFQSLFPHLEEGSYLSRLAGGDEALFGDMERKGLRDFTGTMGNLASRFSGMGTGGRHSSGFQLSQGAEARNLTESLAAQRQQLQQQAIRDLMGLSTQLLGQNPYETVLSKPSDNRKWWEKGLSGLSGAAGAAGGAYLGGPAGAQVGYNLGSQFGNAFSGGGY